MAKFIAVAGKGGVGKTTFTALMLKDLVRSKKGASILAVDADPNANLNEALGLDVEVTIAELLEQTKDPKAIPAGMPKNVFVEYKLQQSLVESKQIDLLVMGGPQGPGCYCYPNDLLRKHLEDLSNNYDFVAVDTEAGLEHLSRRTIQKIDVMFVISDSSARGIRSAGRVYDLIKGLKTPVDAVYLVVTKTAEGTLENLKDEIDKTGLQLIGDIPLDPQVTSQDVQGKPLFDLPDDSLAVKAVENIVRKAKVY
ncbi:MAG TPA: AAA family ATPase [Candidatus Deferrimicrobium sp.]|nr:AAA family ATPase [Candidatus Deferrimicrobium sp.]